MNSTDKEYTIDEYILALARTAENISEKIAERMFEIEDEMDELRGCDSEREHDLTDEELARLDELDDELLRLNAKADAISYVLGDISEFC